MRAVYDFKIYVEETLAADVDAAKSPVVKHKFADSGLLDGTAMQQVARILTLTGGALTLDLTSLIGTNGIAIDGTGLRVQLLKIVNLSQSAPLTFGQGASNGYPLHGAITLQPGQKDMFFGNNQSAVISPTVKSIDLTGGSGETFELHLVLG